nr:zinc finger BED domain-containing protein RICESLEEPER 2-like [Ipomoea batatas]
MWNNPDNLRAVDAIEKATQQTNSAQQLPSFTVCLNGDIPTQGWGDVEAIVRQYDDVPMNDPLRGSRSQSPDAVSTGIPSFSLGLTQEHPTTRWEEVEAIARQYDVVPSVVPIRGSTSHTPTAVCVTNHSSSPSLTEDHPTQLWAEAEAIARKNAELFNYGGWSTRREDFMLLLEGYEVAVAIINAWASVLNFRERVSNSVAPRSHRLQLFTERMEAELKLTSYATWGDVDMHDLLSVFFEDSGFPALYIKVTAMQPRRLRMSWLETKNKIDCGVFAMRHMETYVGQSIASWDCGILRGDARCVREMRVRLLLELLLFHNNTHPLSNVNAVGGFEATIH